MSSAENNWDEVETQVGLVVSESTDSFDPATVVNASELLAVIRNNFEVPKVYQGYWPTIIFSWGKDWEIEVFSDHIEVYRFPADGRIDIHHYAHHPGEPFSAELMAELSYSDKST